MPKIPDPSNIPRELAARAQWVMWRYEERDGKRTKVPYNPKPGGGLASSTDPATWGSLAQALHPPRRADGIGFVVTAEDPFCGIDLDHCVRESEIAEWAVEILRKLNSYAEITPSGNGLRVWILGKLPEGGRKRGHIEMYDRGRYFTVTGNRIEGMPLTIESRQVELASLHQDTFGDNSPIAGAKGARPFSPVSRPDPDVLQAMLQSRNGARIARLYEGNLEDYQGDHSRADAGLMNYLAFYSGGDPAQMERLFRSSGLKRAKLDEAHRAFDKATYLQMTLELALKGRTEYWNAPGFEMGRGKGDNNGATTKGESPRQEPVTVKPAEPDVFTAAELWRMQIPDPLCLVDNLLYEGLNLLVGSPKIGKSWLAFSIGVSVATGGRVLGQFAAQKAGVLYLALEDGKRRLQRRLWQMRHDDPGATPDVLAGLHLTTKWARIGGGFIKALEEWLDTHPECQLVIADTFQRIRPPSRRGNAYEEDYDAIIPMQQLALSRHVSMLIVHHTRKGSADDVFDEVSGTHGITGAADATFLLKRPRGESIGCLTVTGRDIEEQKLAVKFEDGFWTFMGDAHEYVLSEERRAILDVLRGNDRSMSPTEIGRLLGKQRSAVARLLFKLRQDGLVFQTDPGRYMAEKIAKSGNAGNTGNTGNTGNSGNAPPENGVTEPGALPPLPPLPPLPALPALPQNTENGGTLTLSPDDSEMNNDDRTDLGSYCSE